MPIYEFYCEDCHTVFSFLSRQVNTTKRPACPRCERPRLERRVSMFAISKGLEEKADDDLPPGLDLDEDKLERAMAGMAGELENVDEDDPRAMGRVMRRLFDASGLPVSGGMEEALRRLEAGEDPDAIEADLGDVLEGEDPLGLGGKPSVAGLRRKYLPPRVDETLYEM